MLTGTIRAVRCACAMLCALAALALTAPGHAQCAGDINGDGKVDGGDLALVLSNWGFCPPSVTSVTPLQGSVLGGTVLTINGAGFGGTVSVTVGGVPCTGVQVLSPTQVRATTPPGAVGQAPIAVTAVGGTSLSPQPFTYVEQQIQSIVPSSGPYIGGTAITITGQYLAGTTSVTIGGVPCTNVVNVSSTQITAVTPAGSVGAVDLVVTGAKGSVTVAGGFTYLSVVTPSWATLLEPLPDPAVVTDAALRAAITATGLAWRVKDTATQIEFVLIPPGTFQMGCSASQQSPCQTDESPNRVVTLTRAYYMGRFEVTQAQWTDWMGSNPSFFQGSSYPDASSRPVEDVFWTSVQVFLGQTGLRLPTEAEWEWAARAATVTAYHGHTLRPLGFNDDSLLSEIAWFGSTSGGQTRTVGGKFANGFGLYDMSGNVCEWLADWYSGSYYAAAGNIDPLGPVSGTTRVIRGGCFSDAAGRCRSSSRYYREPDLRAKDIGFRVARNP